VVAEASVVRRTAENGRRKSFDMAIPSSKSDTSRGPYRTTFRGGSVSFAKMPAIVRVPRAGVARRSAARLRTRTEEHPAAQRATTARIGASDDRTARWPPSRELCETMTKSVRREWR
jgi:hypothetical protein